MDRLSSERRVVPRSPAADVRTLRRMPPVGRAVAAAGRAAAPLSGRRAGGRGPPRFGLQSASGGAQVNDLAPRNVPELFLERVGRTPEREAFRFPIAGGGCKSLTWLETEAR